MKITISREYTVWCENCRAFHTMRTDSPEFIEYRDHLSSKTGDVVRKFFQKKGWREIDGKTLCPKCALRRN